MHGKVFVTDGRSLATLAIARALGSNGLEVHVGEEFDYSLSSFSKYVERTHRYPSAEEEPRAFQKRVRSLIRAERYDMVIPVRDATTARVAAQKEKLERETGLCIVDEDTLGRLADKGECMKLAALHGVSIPKTYFPAEEGLDRIAREASFPVLIKPRRSSGSRGIVRVDRPDDLESRYRTVAALHPDPIVQEYIDHAGGHYSIGTLFDRDSEPIATHVYRETKQYPISGGPAVNAESIEREPWVDELLRLLRAVDWQGPAHMDVLYDASDESYNLLEVNPRFWMSLNLTIQAGVDVPTLMYELVTEDDSRSVDSYRIGLKYRWLLPNELLWLASHEEKVSAIRDVVRLPDGNTCFGVCSASDLGPVLGVAAQSVNFLADPKKRAAIFDRGW